MKVRLVVRLPVSDGTVEALLYWNIPIKRHLSNDECLYNVCLRIVKLVQLIAFRSSSATWAAIASLVGAASP